MKGGPKLDLAQWCAVEVSARSYLPMMMPHIVFYFFHLLVYHVGGDLKGANLRVRSPYSNYSAASYPRFWGLGSGRDLLAQVSYSKYCASEVWKVGSVVFPYVSCSCGFVKAPPALHSASSCAIHLFFPCTTAALNMELTSRYRLYGMHHYRRVTSLKGDLFVKGA